MAIKKIIGFGNISIYHLNPLLSAAFLSLRSYTLIELKSQCCKWSKHDPLFLTLVMYLGKSCVGIFDLIATLKSKSKVVQTKNDELQYGTATSLMRVIIDTNINIKHDNNDNKNENRRNKQLLTFIAVLGISLLDFIGFVGLQYVIKWYQDGSDLQTQIRTFKLIFDSGFCYLFLQYRVYRHHYVSIGLLILGTVLVTVQGVDFNYVLIIIYLSHSFVISVRDCWEKWVIEYKFISAIRMLFYRGVLGGIISLMLGIIFSNTGISPFSIFDSFNMVFTTNTNTTIWFIVYFLCCIFYNLFYSLTKQYFSPTHMSVTDSFSAIVWMIILLCIPSKGQVTAHWGLLVVGYASVLLGCLIYNDILILYFCGLDRNTKKEVTRRSIKEISYEELRNLNEIQINEEIL